ncbi:glycoside hydrolase family 16 protein [Durotheca rogersii]|uniref:glycoside hydrolase family 16 protein n=1 Tax=Durotheca rogersii TaxID=419775 RepID=UPI00221E56C3|nr:glycoside hydrolase family 16 protein [Durotheca rogersii]KAI5866116.1 glycoside hydrolase family 16 protein [Durotheca rogersii]
MTDRLRIGVLAVLTPFLLLSLAPPPAAGYLAHAGRQRKAGPIDPSGCECFVTDGPSAASFAQYKFFDFRDLPGAGTPAPLADGNRSAAAPVTSAYFDSREFASAWTVQSRAGGLPPDGRVLVANQYSRNNVYVAPNADARPASRTYLALRTLRRGSFQSSAEVQSASAGYQHLSARVFARVRGDPGAVAAMFTYRGAAAAARVQEADLEVLTGDPATLVHYTNQPSQVGGVERPGATQNATIPGPWAAWHVHRYDWTPGASTWYVDGRCVASNNFQAPRDPANFLFNSWSNGGSWSGLMADGGLSVMDIQWVEFLYNNTAEPSRFSYCSKACSVD